MGRRGQKAVSVIQEENLWGSKSRKGKIKFVTYFGSETAELKSSINNLRVINQ